MKNKNKIGFELLFEDYFNYIETENVDKNTLLYGIDKPIKKIYFCEKGIIRVYNYDKHNEITRGFFSENEVVIPAIALKKNIPVFTNIQAIEKCEMQIITIGNLKKIEKENPELVKDVLFDATVNILEHLFFYQSINSYCLRIRYTEMVKRYPYFKRINGKYIASFLGDTPENFSRKVGDIHKKMKN